MIDKSIMERDDADTLHRIVAELVKLREVVERARQEPYSANSLAALERNAWRIPEIREIMRQLGERYGVEVPPIPGLH